MIVILLGGLWHGADWAFVLWGGLRGLYLTVNHGYRKLANRHHGTYVTHFVIEAARYDRQTSSFNLPRVRPSVTSPEPMIACLEGREGKGP